MTWTTSTAGHYSSKGLSDFSFIVTRLLKYLHHNDGDKEASENEEDTSLIQVRHGLVERADYGTSNPRDDDVGYKHVPGLSHIVRVLERIPAWEVSGLSS